MGRFLRACLATTAVVLAAVALAGCSSEQGGAGPTTTRQHPLKIRRHDLPAVDDTMLAECARRTGANRGCPGGGH
jgi:hypothetical protein